MADEENGKWEEQMKNHNSKSRIMDGAMVEGREGAWCVHGWILGSGKMGKIWLNLAGRTVLLFIFTWVMMSIKRLMEEEE